MKQFSVRFPLREAFFSTPAPAQAEDELEWNASFGGEIEAADNVAYLSDFTRCLRVNNFFLRERESLGRSKDGKKV
jgi:hypothetical protein